MSRKRKSGGSAGVDLFSFLNIMAATIGVQALLIVICALQIKPGSNAVKLIPSEGSAKGGLTAQYIILNGKGKLDIISFANTMTVSIDDPKLNEFLQSAAEKKDNTYLIVGVRPNSYHDFIALRSKIESKNIRMGYEPLEANVKVVPPSSQASRSTS